MMSNSGERDKIKVLADCCRMQLRTHLVVQFKPRFGWSHWISPRVSLTFTFTRVV